MRIARLENAIQEYDWGSRTALAELLGFESPAPRPQAELWMGAHPSAPSRVVLPSGPVPLDRWIAADPAGVLGTRVAERFENALPFLLKVLAVEHPLSIQAHPDATRAREGFLREEADGIALRDDARSYRDPHPKPELIYALSPFRMLAGFRPPEAIAATLEELGVPAQEPRLRLPDEGLPAERRRAFLSALLEARTRDTAETARSIADAASLRAGDDPLFAGIARLHEEHPEDLGLLAPAFLELLELAPGQALFMPTGELHCYLEGVGVELMASSDNVLRGGLTPKSVDARELLRVASFDEPRALVVAPHRDEAATETFPAPADEFLLARIGLDTGSATPHSAPDRCVEVLFCAEGEAELAPDDGTDPIALGTGESCIAPAAAGGYELRGRGTVFRASVPDSQGGS